jgi:hypothetical protein
VRIRMRSTQLRRAIVSYVYSRVAGPPNNKWLEEICVSFYGLDFHSADIYPLSIFAYARRRLRVPHCAVLALALAFEGFFFFRQRPGFLVLGPRHDRRRLEELRSVRIDVRVIVRRSAETSKTLKSSLACRQRGGLVVGALRSLRALPQVVRGGCLHLALVSSHSHCSSAVGMPVGPVGLAWLGSTSNVRATMVSHL